MDTIDLTPTTRLVIEQDEWTDNPLDWGNVVTVPLGRWSDIGEHGTDDLDLAHARREFDFRGLDSDAAIRWARIFHGVPVVEADGAYWYLPASERSFHATGEPIPAAEQERYLDNERTTYGQYRDGEVYVVALERRVAWQALDGSGRTEDRWEAADSLGGCYLDDGYTPAQVAEEHFDLTAEEAAALKVAA